jgi:hypothetical protein
MSRPAKKATQQTSKGFTAEERAAMPEPDRTLGKRLHAIIKASAPALAPRLWSGQLGRYATSQLRICGHRSMMCNVAVAYHSPRGEGKKP